MMKAIRFHEFGEADVLRYEDTPEPSIGPADILLELKAAALNHLDLWVRTGARERNIPLPHIPGSDGAGIVAKTGSDVGFIKPGDRILIAPGLSCGHCIMCLSGRDNLCRDYRVLGTRDSGTCAQYVRIPAINAVPIPEGMDFTAAAAVPLVFLTAYHMLVSVARVKRGETVLVHGAGSGVGSAGIQIAKLIGARVITTAGSEVKLAKAKTLGADEIINYNANDFVLETRRLTEKRGVDVVFEHIGGEVFEKSIPLLVKGGRLVTCGATTEYMGKVDLRYVYSRHISIHGSFMGTKYEMLEVMKLFRPGGQKTLQPVIDIVLPLQRAADAHRRLEERKNFGKVILTL